MAMASRAASTEPPPPSERGLVVLVEREPDIFRARLEGKVLCEKIGLSDLATTKVVTAISELARNIFSYAGTGSVVLRRLDGPPRGIEVVASDCGPGIADVAAVLLPTYRSRTGMGGGLRGTRDLMDFFDLSSRLGQGTVVTIRKLQI
jgi:serine/threonine-protein kinase RsbT